MKIKAEKALRPGAQQIGGDKVDYKPSPAGETAESVLVSQEPVQNLAQLMQFERCEEVEIGLPDGRTVTMARPKFGLFEKVNTILKDAEFKDDKLMNEAMACVRALLYVTQIDGKAIQVPNNAIDFAFLEQQLGVDGVDAVKFAFATRFTPLGLTTQGFKIVKKS